MSIGQNWLKKKPIWVYSSSLPTKVGVGTKNRALNVFEKFFFVIASNWFQPWQTPENDSFFLATKSNTVQFEVELASSFCWDTMLKINNMIFQYYFCFNFTVCLTSSKKHFKILITKFFISFSSLGLQFCIVWGNILNLMCNSNELTIVEKNVICIKRCFFKKKLIADN